MRRSGLIWFLAYDPDLRGESAMAGKRCTQGLATDRPIHQSTTQPLIHPAIKSNHTKPNRALHFALP